MKRITLTLTALTLTAILTATNAAAADIDVIPTAMAAGGEQVCVIQDTEVACFNTYGESTFTISMEVEGDYGIEALAPTSVALDSSGILLVGVIIDHNHQTTNDYSYDYSDYGYGDYSDYDYDYGTISEAEENLQPTNEIGVIIDHNHQPTNEIGVIVNNNHQPVYSLVLQFDTDGIFLSALEVEAVDSLAVTDGTLWAGGDAGVYAYERGF